VAQQDGHEAGAVAADEIGDQRLHAFRIRAETESGRKLRFAVADEVQHGVRRAFATARCYSRGSGFNAFGPAVITFQPRMSLRDRISAIMLVEDADTERMVLPTASAVLGIQTSGRVRAETGLLSVAGVTGVQNVARKYAYVGKTTSLLVRFTPQGIACLGVPACQLASRNIGLHEILRPDRVERMHERMRAARTAADSVAVLEDFLAQLPFTGDPLVAQALKLVASSSTRPTGVAEVARLLGLSERQLERRFLERVGVTPKRFATLRRFERAIASASTTPSLTAVALDAGYYDQSHFIREFRRFTGVSPGTLLRTPR
jgi:AraC-like DNA-binding protein